MLTASRYERATICPASVTLPGVENVNAFAANGQGVHLYLSEVGVRGIDAALEMVPPEWRAGCEALPVEDLPVSPDAWSHEMAFALDVQTGESRMFGTAGHRDYGTLGEWEIAGTADVVGIEGRCLILIDYKTGRGEVTPAARNGQLRILAVMAARATGCTSARVALLHVVEGQRPRWDWHALDSLDLDLALEEARRVVAATRQAAPVIRTGAHCRYCPAFSSCPAQWSLARQLGSGEEGQALVSAMPITRESLPSIYERVKAAKLLISHVESAVTAAALEYGGVEVREGVWYGPRETTTERIDGSVALPVLREALGDLADIALEVSTSKAAIDRALKATGNPVAPQRRALLDSLRTAGAINERTTTTIKEYSRSDTK